VESKKSGKHMVMMGIGARTGEAATIMDEFFGTGSWAPVKYNRCFYSNEAVDNFLNRHCRPSTSKTEGDLGQGARDGMGRGSVDLPL